MSENTKFAKQPIVENLPKVGETNALSKPVTSNSVSSPQESKGVNNDKVITLGMFRINPDKTYREAKKVPNTVSASNRTKPITVSQPPVVTKKDPRKSRLLLRWSPTGRLFDQESKIVDSSESVSQSDCVNGDNACTSNSLEPKIKRFPNSTSLLDRGDRSINLYTINLHEMASASPICLMDRASSTKSWLWHQRLSHLNFDTINDLARNDLVSGFPKFKYHKEHICPSCEQGKSKRASHSPKPIPNLRQRLHLLHMDLCGPMRIASINGKWYVLVIVDNYSRYSWVHFLRSKDEAPVVIIMFLKRITNDREDIGKLGAKGDIGFFIGYSADSCAYIIYNRRSKKIIETMNVSFDELSAMAFEQRSSKPELQSMTSGQISSGLDLTYAPSTITT
nr:retrovirus-related Pol polyprotein from transposon TNT 1-94 [Tanacetum cinerariifolium]